MNEDSAPTTATKATPTKKRDSIDGILFGRGNYKLWVIAAIFLLAIWSIFTGTVTLKWSSSRNLLNHFSDDFDSPFLDDLDVLEIEEREKVVKHMWEVYTQSRRIRLPKFWQEAFEAAYEELVSDDPAIRESAISEIAKMSSIRSINFDPPPLPSTTNVRGGTNKSSSFKEAEGGDDGKKKKKKKKVQSE